MLGSNNVTIVAPGQGLCGVDGSVPPGPYNLTQVAPPGTSFDGWVCYNVTGNSSMMIGTDPSVLLQNAQSVTCVANYKLLESTCADVQPAVPGEQQYNCSRATMAFNTSAAMMTPANDPNCCMVSGGAAAAGSGY
jgi:hypothetical protein